MPDPPPQAPSGPLMARPTRAARAAARVVWRRDTHSDVGLPSVWTTLQGCGPRCGAGQVLVTCPSSWPHRAAPCPALPPLESPSPCPVLHCRQPAPGWQPLAGLGLAPLASASLLPCDVHVILHPNAKAKTPRRSAPSPSRSCDFPSVSGCRTRDMRHVFLSGSLTRVARLAV